MRLLLLSAPEIERALPMVRAVEVMKEAFRAFSAGETVVPQRLSIPFAEGAGTLLVKPGALPGRILGTKLAAVVPGNAARGRPATSALMVCLSPETGDPEALLDGTALTAWRTGAAAGAATALLSPADASVAALLGAGGQARAQALALAAVRPLAELRVFSPTSERVDALLETLRDEPPCRLRAAPTARAALDGAQIVCAATTSATPVFDDSWITPGTHVNGIGSFRPAMREIPSASVARSAVVVDSRESAALEAGELVHAAAQGLTDPTAWVELGEVVAGRPVAAPEGGITLFKSVGLAVQDLAAAAAVLEEARRLGLGEVVEL